MIFKGENNTNCENLGLNKGRKDFIGDGSLMQQTADYSVHFLQVEIRMYR